MAIIYSYPTQMELDASDMLIGTARVVEDNVTRQVTKNFTLGQLQDFIGSGLTLSTIGNNGPATLVNNVLNIPIYNNGNTYDFIAPLYNVDQVVYMVSATGSNDGYLKYTDWNTFNNKQGAITLTTTGTSGVATFVGNTLNIPNYSAAAVTPTLDEVLNEGNTSEVNAYVGGEFGLYDIANTAYSTLNAFDNTFTFNDSNGEPVLYFEQGILAISKSPTIAGTIGVSLLSVSRNYSLPDASGTIALTSDIPSLAGYVQTSRTLTINGTTYDLSANRTWSVGTVTDVIGSGLITSTGGANPVISTQIHTNVLVGRTTAGTGVMEEITVGSGLTLSAGTLSATSTGGGIQHAIASGTDTYTATVSGVTSYADGDAYLINFTNANTTTATLNINSLGAIPLYRNNDGQILGGDIWAAAEMLCVYNATANTFQCIGTSPNSLFAYVTNADSVAITKGQPVYAFGGQGDRLTVKRALNTSDATSAQTVGVVLTSSIAVNQKGIIIIQGLLDGLSILPTSTWADGDPVYLGTTAGSITNVKQYAPNHLVYLGTVTTASNGSAGRWYVRVQNGYELDELHNVQAQSPSLKDTLWYDSGVTPGQWKTASIPTILGYTPFNLPSLSSGSVLFSDGTTIAQDNNNFFWNNSTKKLGIGTSTPSATFTIQDSSGSQILLKSTVGIEGISSFGGGTLASYDITTGGGTYQYGPLTMIPSVGFITYGGFEVLTGNITTGYIPRKAPIGVEDSLIYDDGTNVGIGTSTPAYKLNLYGSTNLYNIGTTENNSEYYIGHGISVPSISPTPGNITAKIGFENDAPTNFYSDAITFSTTIPVAFPANFDNTTERMRITSGGFVGIGTTNPATELEVAGVITATGGNSTSWNAKQDALVSGTNIKTINGSSVLGSGDLTISGASGGIHAQKIIYTGQYTNLYVVYAGAPSTQAATANRLICMPFFPNQTFTSQSLVVNVTTLSAGGLAKVLIFSDVDGRPTTKLYESADFDCSTTGQKTASVSFTFTAGTTYWLGFVCNNGTNAFSHLGQGSVYAFSTNSATGAATHGWLSVTYASIPSPLSALSYQSGNIPLVSIRNS